MKVLVNLLISLVALHSCSASYLKFYDRPMEICPAQNQKIVELVQECQMKIFESIQITKTKTDEILYQGYQQWVIYFTDVMILIHFFVLHFQQIKDLSWLKTGKRTRRMHYKIEFNYSSMHYSFWTRTSRSYF